MALTLDSLSPALSSEHCSCTCVQTMDRRYSYPRCVEYLNLRPLTSLEPRPRSRSQKPNPLTFVGTHCRHIFSRARYRNILFACACRRRRRYAKYDPQLSLTTASMIKTKYVMFLLAAWTTESVNGIRRS